MSSLVIKNFEVESSPLAMQMGAYAGPAMAASIREAPAFFAEVDCVAETNAEDGSFFKGVLWALGIEAAMAICLYGIWQLWHIWR